ncbi:2-oxoacid:acceptor oxidoreductase subunit alpha [Desulfotalea psychrophila]|uniref:Probable 2-oxoacid ferredoxin oxidoreductase, alpha subunit n=1 Tax=Desulfotalea psychrophila (strain LSv54 / DSM 12343) TaxID=177439 RepID=Q6ALE3_DESPS|nr:2-oxoacid:acceptor oxidoreductase subunit alpha [Desulfotalea psychrophila]CAG36832.1 probable 2-oxoacid ferredoxin oxidoreductase, alpha subunit [Desulfotalea psychrophila LSv54]
MGGVKGFTLVLGGEAGQGIQFLEKALLHIVKESGLYVFATKEYMSRVRGGINTTEIRISSEPVRAHVDVIDLLIPLKNGVIEHLGSRVTKSTTIVGSREHIGGRDTEIDFAATAKKHGNQLYTNSVALGFLCGLLDFDSANLYKEIRDTFSLKSEGIIAGNIDAAEEGYKIGMASHSRLLTSGRPTPAKNRSLQENLLLNGADAVALGAMAGGCNAAFAYPMTPGTSVFLTLAEFSKQADIVVEQVEDEIGVINMAIGSWYAGGRAIVSTSGGGFALMTEGISLAGMTETPVVVHLAQRPGPATGLPTRTEQGDLNLVLYAGHGEFARLILAPGTLEQAFEYTRLAFNLADRFQIPVFVLTDQFFVDSYYPIAHPDAGQVQIESAVIKTDDSYKRYQLSEDGVSPRGIPGYGSGNVCLDSDEHDEDGKITEDLDGIHLAMADNRLKKLETLTKAAMLPELVGEPDYATLIIGWGSTYGAICEALQIIGSGKVSFLFCPQLYPLSEKIAEYIDGAQKVVVVENNQLGQFADFLQRELGRLFPHRILKYNGMPFSVEELVQSITEEMI